MSDHELRTDPFDGRRSLVVGGRADRPGGGPQAQPIGAVDPTDDPFLEGHEDRTPPELDADRPSGGDANGPGWLTRVVPNAFPLVTPDAPDAEPEAVTDLFRATPAIGHHEVIVQAPTATASLAELGGDRLGRVLAMWQRRLRAHEGAAARHLIVNEGAAAGASQPHSHAQLVVLPTVPAALARERERAEAYAAQTTGGNLAADVLQEEVRRGRRVIAVDDDCVLLAAWAPRGAFHLRIHPRRTALRFEDEPAGIGAPMLADALRRLTARFGQTPASNLWLRTAVAGAERTCWRIDLLPVLAPRGGVELGAGLDVSTVAPEQVAAELRAL